MTCLSRQVKDDVLIPYEMAQAKDVADVRNIDVNQVFDSGNVREVTSILRNQGVNENDVRSKLNERTSKRRTYEA